MAKKQEVFFPGKERCRRCGSKREDHGFGNYADGPLVGRTFLVCPTALWQEPLASPAPRRTRKEGL